MGKHKQKCYCIICKQEIFNRQDNALYCDKCKITQQKEAVERTQFLSHCKKHIKNINMKAYKDLEWELV